MWWCKEELSKVLPAATVVQCIKIPFTWESERGVYSGAAEKNIVAILGRYRKSYYYLVSIHIYRYIIKDVIWFLIRVKSKKQLEFAFFLNKLDGMKLSEINSTMLIKIWDLFGTLWCAKPQGEWFLFSLSIIQKLNSCV